MLVYENIQMKRTGGKKKITKFSKFFLVGLVLLIVIIFAAIAGSKTAENVEEEKKPIPPPVAIVNNYFKLFKVTQVSDGNGNLVANQFDIEKMPKEIRTPRTPKDKMYEYVLGIDVSKNKSGVVVNGSICKNPDVNNMVALTFDDGPYPLCEEYLKIFAKYKIKVTFFLLGKNVSYSPKMSQAIRDAGHEIASHSWNHTNLSKLSKSATEEDFRKTDEAFQEVLGMKPTLFRAPYGALNTDVLAVATE